MTYKTQMVFVKEIKLILYGFAILLSYCFFMPRGIDEIINALKNGNATELAHFIDESLVISLPDKSDSYNKSQAEMVLKDFFVNNGVKGFDLQFKGENGGSEFFVGKLITKSGGYRTTVFLRIRSGHQVIKEIRFQPM